jgi:enoyl-CoA hydratase
MANKPAVSGLTITFTARGVATIAIDNSSRMNAMTAAMWEALPSAVARIQAKPEIRVLIVRGEGTRAFSAGADISEFDTARAGATVHRYDELNHNAFDALANCTKPTIAMIHGFCLGGGLGLALACDLRVADQAATFAIPAAKLGIGYNPRWIAQMLQVVSPAVAKEILFTGRRFDASEALARGLVSQVFPTEKLDDAVNALAHDIASNAPLSVHASKVMVNDLARKGDAADRAALDRLVSACFDSADYAEGRKAFAEKRKPVFKGA